MPAESARRPGRVDGSMASVNEAKATVRARVWQHLHDSGVGRGRIVDRIPDFIGSDGAARRLADLEQWQVARTIMANPDRAQQPVRALALGAGKLLFMAVPGLAGRDPFYRLDPDVLNGHVTRVADRRVAAEVAPTVALDQMSPIDIIVCGSVAVDRHGVRVGKGAGYSDREIEMLAGAGLIRPGTIIVTTVHELQVSTEPLPSEPHDVLVDYVVTPERVIAVSGRR